MHDLICDVIYNSISGPKENGNSIMNSDNDQMNLAYALFAIMVRVVTERLSTGRIRSLFWPVHSEPLIQPWLLHHISLFICTVSIVRRNEGPALWWTRSRVQRTSSSSAVSWRTIPPLDTTSLLFEGFPIGKFDAVLIFISAKLWVKAWYDTYCSCRSNFKLIKSNRCLLIKVY